MDFQKRFADLVAKIKDNSTAFAAVEDFPDFEIGLISVEQIYWTDDGDTGWEVKIRQYENPDKVIAKASNFFLYRAVREAAEKAFTFEWSPDAEHSAMSIQPSAATQPQS